MKKGRDRGGDFQERPRLPREALEPNCVVAFSTFNATPPENAVFGRTGTSGREVLCTNPAALGGGSAPITPISPSAPFAPRSTIAAAITITGVKLPTAKDPVDRDPERVHGALLATPAGRTCSTSIRCNAALGLPSSPAASWGLHLVDANIALGNLVGLVKTQIGAYESRR